MAYNFNPPGLHRLDLDTLWSDRIQNTAGTVSMSGIVRLETMTNNAFVFGFFEGVTLNRLSLYVATGGAVVVAGRSDSTDGFTSTFGGVGGITTGTAYQVGGSMHLSTSGGGFQRVYRDGEMLAEKTGLSFSRDTFDGLGASGQQHIGLNNTSAADYVDGDLTNVGMWSVELTDSEWAFLGAGGDVRHVRPDARLLIAPMINSTQDYVRRSGLTSTFPPDFAPEFQRRIFRSAQILQFEGGVASDTTPPIVSTATIPSAGDVIVVQLNERMAIGAGGSLGSDWSISLGGLSVSATAIDSGDETLINLTPSRTITSDDGGFMTLSYTQPGNGYEDEAGNDLASFAGVSITNNSTQSAGGPPPSGGGSSDETAMTQSIMSSIMQPLLASIK